MPEHLVESLAVSEEHDAHLQPVEVAAYVDGAVTGAARARLDAHLADCVECRDEVVDAGRIAARMSRARIRGARQWIPAVAAAAVVLLIARPSVVREPGPEHREAPVTTTVMPRALVPVGPVDSVTSLVWSSVPFTDRYRVRIFDANGSVVWERETTDTMARLPASVTLRPARTYFWKVESQIGFGRTAATDLIEFSVRRVRQP